MKYRIWRDIRNVCYPPTIKIDRNKFKLNLKIKSMVYSFILVLSITELVANILFQSSQISKFNSKIIIVYPEIISEDCVIESTYMIQLLNKSTFMIARAQNIGIVLWAMFPILLSLFFVILRHTYLNHPYNRCIRKYIIYIILQFVVKSSLSRFMQTWYISQFFTSLWVWLTFVYTYLLLTSSIFCSRVEETKRDSTQLKLITFRRYIL